MSLWGLIGFIALVTALVVGAIWLSWWCTGQFFSGSQHWAAFWILLAVGGGCSCRCKK